MKLSRTLTALLCATALTTNAASVALANGANQPVRTTATPIKHLIVIYQENVSFDHYFGTYPHATNPKGEPAFHARKNTPTDIDTVENAGLLTNNPNFLNTLNGTGAANPFRLDVTQSASADQNHSYTPEQQAEDNGAADLFPLYTGVGSPGGVGTFGTTGQVMGYYDGNTITAMWNYAQHFAMSDNARTDGYGPSTPGAIEAVSGQTNGMQIVLDTNGKNSYYVADGQGGYTLINDVDPAYDVCASTTNTSTMAGKNVGDLLNAARITWGSFMGGFDLTRTNPNGTTGCARSTVSNVTEVNETDYIPHHAWFQYYPSTSNPTHARPSSVAAIGHSYEPGTKTLDPANHEYDINDFYTAVQAGNFPSVSYIKAPAFQDAHAGYSDPTDEQYFLVTLINFLQQQKKWKDTAVVIAYDDSDGWYDHSYTAATSSSYTSADQLNGAGVCGTGTQQNGVSGKPVDGRCGPGVRTPFMVISKYAKKNYVSHTPITQASIVKFIEDNWLGGARLGGGSFDDSTGSIMDMFDFTSSKAPATKLILDPDTGLQTAALVKKQ
ncbi:MAG TPA: alkaline phosphatase family protein [Rhizomicrobium sp.]|jgi:phospholipase C|nr:alkaline phosphatase family protein [Rhizomicrobium sp.]